MSSSVAVEALWNEAKTASRNGDLEAINSIIDSGGLDFSSPRGTHVLDYIK